MIQSRLLRRLSHPISIVGLVIIGVGFVASLIGLVAELGGDHPSPYQGLLTFVLYPSVSMVGGGILLVGVLLERRHARKLREAKEKWHPTLQLSDRRHRIIVWGLSIFTLAFVSSSVVGAYHAFEFTESKSFCGELCHEPMEPQFVAHGNSPHAQVACTTCHVGAGVTGYVEAKLAGLHQLKQMILDDVPRPIVASAEKRAVVSESCETCHAPDEMAAVELGSSVRYGYDLANTERPLRLMFRRSLDPELGNHWHSGLEISFRAADDRERRIPWVRVRRSDGSEAIYEDRTWGQQSAGVALLEERPMVCIDCHSRPAHRFENPDHAVNSAIASGEIDPALPSIKKIAVAAVARDHGEDVEASVRSFVEGYYRDNLSERVLERAGPLDRAIGAIARIHSENSFATMQTNWRTHPDHDGHRESPGCFRCHGGQHSSTEGTTLLDDCATCHLFFEKERGTESLLAISPDGASFHPFRHEDHPMHECWTCHKESGSPYESCSSCHKDQVGGHAMKFECSICHQPGKVEADPTNCGTCHPRGDSPMHSHVEHGTCLDCHAPHNWNVAAESCAASGCHEGTGSEYLEQYRDAFLGIGFTMQGLTVPRSARKP